MQFIESSALGVRAACLSFRATSTYKRITLYPMVHIGEANFYEKVYRDALLHDVVLFEGVNSPITTRVTRSYRWLIGSRAMRGLIVQPKLTSEDSHARLIHADLTHQEFSAEWLKIPVWIRAVIYVIAPILGLQRRWFATRRSLSKDMSFEDQPSIKELMAISPETGALTQAVLEARDTRLLERLRHELDGDQSCISIAVVYGAAHMRAVLRELTGQRGFAVVGAEWQTVMSLDQ